MFRKILYIFCVMAVPVLAVPVHMEFQGEIYGLIGDPALGGSIPVGSLFEGHLSYDTDIVSQSQHMLGHSSYVCDEAAELVLTVNGYIFSSSNVTVSVDHYAYSGHDRVSISGAEYTVYDERAWSMGFTFANPWENVLTSTELPTVPLNLAHWPIAYVSIADEDATSLPIPQISGQITSITPEPASLALLLVGGLAVVRRR